MSTTTLSRPELARLLGVAYRQVRDCYFEDASTTDDRGRHHFAPETVRRLQVAASLAHAIPTAHSRQSAFPNVARAVLAHPDEPEPRSWAIFKDGTVTYVRYSADLAGAVDMGGVVAYIDKLWPDVSAASQEDTDA